MRLRIEHSWGIEGAATLLWAMGLGDKKLSAMNVTCSPDLICDLVRELNISGMVKKAKVLSSQAIDRELEGVETAHWKVRDAALRGKPTPKTLEPDLILLRHHSLNWLTRYTNDDWDDVPTDT